MVKCKQNSIKWCKTKFILFKTKQKPCDTELRFTLCRKILNKTNHVRYLGIKINENLNWKIPVYDLASKLNRAIQHYLNQDIF